MFDSVVLLDSPTFGMCLWCFFLVMITIAITWSPNYNYSPYQGHLSLKGWRTNVLFALFLLLALTYWLDHDTYAYMNLAKSHDVDFILQDGLDMEKGHQVLCSIVNGNWLGFRILCWGSALCLFAITAKRLDINTQHALFCLFISWYHTFCYGRVTLAMAIYFFGVSFLCKPLKSKLLSYIVGIAIIISSIYFHRSALLLIAITPALYAPIIKKRISIFYIFMCFAIIFFVIFQNINMLYLSTDMSEDTMRLLERYSNADTEVRNIIGTIFKYISFGAKYLPIAIITYVITKSKQTEIPRYILMLYFLMIVILFVSITFYFTGESQYTLFYRTLNFTMIPASLILAYLHFKGIMGKRLFLYAIALGAFDSFWRVFHATFFN